MSYYLLPEEREKIVLKHITNNINVITSYQNTNIDEASSSEIAIKITWGLIIGSSIGNILEWYDFAAFGFLADEIGDQFSPDTSTDTAKLLFAYAIFAGAFIGRPFGGVFFGYIGDVYGRKIALQISMTVMFMCTFLMGCLPTYNSYQYHIGLWSTFVLCFLRVLQGFSAGGQLVGSMLFIIESCEQKKRAFYGAVILTASVVGQTFGSWIVSLVQSVFTHDQMLEYGWRIPFLLSLIIGIFGTIVQYRMPDSVEFQSVMDNNTMVDNPLVIGFKKYWKQMLCIIFVLVPWSIGFYIIFMWLPTYLSVEMEPHLEHTNIINSCLMIWLCTCILFGGWIADKYHCYRVMLCSTIMQSICCFPLIAFLYYLRGNDFPLVLLQVIFAFLLGMLGGPLQIFMIGIIDDVTVRYSCIGFAYNVCQALFGGPAAVIATSLASVSFLFIGVYLFVANVIAIGFLVYCIQVKLEEEKEEAFYASSIQEKKILK